MTEETGISGKVTPITQEMIDEARGVSGEKGRELRVLSGAQLDAVTKTKALGQQLIDQIRAIGSSRETSLALTNAEQAVMWAVKAITG